MPFPAKKSSAPAASGPNLLELPAHVAAPKMSGLVTYRHKLAGLKTGYASRPTAPSSFSFPADCEFIDPQTGMVIAIRLLGRKQRTPDGKGFFEPVQEVEFDDKGYLVLAPRDQKLFEFMERCSLNAGNPYRDPTKGAYFERIDLDAIAAKQEDFDNTEDDARDHLRGMATDEKARIGAALGLCQLTDSPAVINQSLRAYIKKSPGDFLRHVASPSLACKATVIQALDEKVILFEPATHLIKWGDSLGEVLSVPTGVDAADHLVRFLLGDEKRGELVYKELKKRLDAINNG